MIYQQTGHKRYCSSRVPLCSLRHAETCTPSRERARLTGRTRGNGVSEHAGNNKGPLFAGSSRSLGVAGGGGETHDISALTVEHSPCIAPTHKQHFNGPTWSWSCGGREHLDRLICWPRPPRLRRYSAARCLSLNRNAHNTRASRRRDQNVNSSGPPRGSTLSLCAPSAYCHHRYHFLIHCTR